MSEYAYPIKVSEIFMNLFYGLATLLLLYVQTFFLLLLFFLIQAMNSGDKWHCKVCLPVRNDFIRETGWRRGVFRPILQETQQCRTGSHYQLLSGVVEPLCTSAEPCRSSLTLRQRRENDEMRLREDKALVFPASGSCRLIQPGRFLFVDTVKLTAVNETLVLQRLVEKQLNNEVEKRTKTTPILRHNNLISLE